MSHKLAKNGAQAGSIRLVAFGVAEKFENRLAPSHENGPSASTKMIHAPVHRIQMLLDVTRLSMCTWSADAIRKAGRFWKNLDNYGK